MDVYGVDEQCLSFSNDLNYSATKRGDLKPKKIRYFVDFVRLGIFAVS